MRHKFLKALDYSQYWESFALEGQCGHTLRVMISFDYSFFSTWLWGMAP